MKRGSLLVALILFSSALFAQTSRVGWWALDGGFAAPGSSSTMVKSAVGQVFAGRSAGTSSIVNTGFLADTLFRSVITGIQPEAGTVPREFLLHQNYPNPFNPATTIRYELPHAAHVVLTIYNILGQEVVTLVNEEKPAGVYNVRFEAGGLASGMYAYRLRAGDFVETRKLVLLH
jgi:hypothetical protein